MELKWTGERLVTGIVKEFGVYEHLHRYAVAREYAENKVVLDIASGEGYGSALLSKVALKVYGVDIDEASVHHANLKYGSDKLNFISGSVLRIPLPDNSIDLVVSFETLEHLTEQEQMFSEFKRVLKPDGVLIISTPEKSIYHFRELNNPFHLKELTIAEFKKLIVKEFLHYTLFKQMVVAGSLIVADSAGGDNFKTFDGDYDNISETMRTHELYNQPFFNIAICSNEPIHSRSNASFFNGAEKVIADLEKASQALKNEKIAYQKLRKNRVVRILLKISKIKNSIFSK